MDYIVKRERRRLLEDLIDLQREEDLQRQYPIIRGGFGRVKYESDDEDNYRNSQSRKKKYCFVKLTYRNSSKRRRTNIDEIIISQNKQTIYQGCVEDGEQFIFKLPRSRNDERLKLKFYINDVLEDEMIACCENGLLQRNQRNHFFQIDDVSGAKPCADCESDDSEASERAPSPVQRKSKRDNRNVKVPKTPESKPKQSQEKFKESKRKEKKPDPIVKKKKEKPFVSELLFNKFEETKTTTDDQADILEPEEELITEDDLSEIPLPSVSQPPLFQPPPSQPPLFQPPPAQPPPSQPPLFQPPPAQPPASQPPASQPPPAQPPASQPPVSQPPPAQPPASQPPASQPPPSQPPPSQPPPSQPPVSQPPVSQPPVSQPPAAQPPTSQPPPPQSPPSQPPPSQPPLSQSLLSEKKSDVEKTTTDSSFDSTNKTQPETTTQPSPTITDEKDESDKLLPKVPSIPEQNEPNKSESSESPKPPPAKELVEINKPGPPREKGNVEYFALFYLHDDPLNESALKKLRTFANYVKTFNDDDDCFKSIKKIYNEKIILVMENSFVKYIIDKIEKLPQIYSIYILTKKDHRDDLPPEQSKIRGYYTDITELYEPISNDIKKLTRDLIVYLNASSYSSKMEPVVLYYLLLKEIILDDTDTKNSFKNLIAFAKKEYEGNDEELQMIDEFANTYESDDAIRWLSKPCFISKMVNKSLHVPEHDVLLRLRSFIQDLYQQIQNEAEDKGTTVYLGQTIQRSDLDDLQKTIAKNDTIIFPQFLFGATDQSRAIRIAKEIPPINENIIPLLVKIEIPDGIKCAHSNVGRYATDNDNDVLLNMGIVGRLVKIDKDNLSDEQIATVHIKLVKLENQRNIRNVLETTRNKVKDPLPFVTMIKLLMEIKQQLLAEQILERLFKDETLYSDPIFLTSISTAFQTLAKSYNDKEDHKRAIDFYLMSVETLKRIYSEDAIELSSIYDQIGSLYFRLENYDKAHEFYQKALSTQLQAPVPDLYPVSTLTNSLGLIYAKQEKYPEAIKAHEHALKALERCSEPQETELASTYDNIGDAYNAQSNYKEALDNYLKSLQIQERIQSTDNKTIGHSYHTVGNIYLKLGQTKDALTNLIRAVECFEKVIPMADPTFPSLYHDTALMYFKEGDLENALKYYGKSLEIAGIAFPNNNSFIGKVLYNRALALATQDKLTEAIESLENSTEQYLKTLPEDDPGILENRKQIETIRQRKGSEQSA